ADALHVDRKPLGSALQRRGCEAAITQVRGELVTLDVAGEHAWNALIQRFSHVGGIDAREVLGGERLHHGRPLLASETEPPDRRGGDNLGRGNLGGGGRRGETRVGGRVAA